MMRLRVPLGAGAVLSLAAATALARLDPGAVAWPRLPARHPLASYTALAAAPFGIWWELFALVALIHAACLFAAGWRHARRGDPRKEP
jgi:hypothetical protein